MPDISTVATIQTRATLPARVEAAIRAELDLAGIIIADHFPRMHIGDILYLLIRDHLADYGYSPGNIPLGRELPLRLVFVRENAHDVLMTCALAGHMDWRVDEHKVIHFWLLPDQPDPTMEKS